MVSSAALSKNAAKALDSRALDLILLPTEKCNFRCTYCYEDFKLGSMPAPIVAGVKNLLTVRAPELDELVLSWFGGEPLLATRLIYDISEHAIRLCEDNPNLSYRGSMATNAQRLDAETLNRLFDCGVTSYQITLDGPRDLHDRTRVTRKGEGSFDAIWQNLLGIRDSGLDVQITLRLHYQAHNYRGLFPLIELLNAEFAGDNRFQVHFKSVSRLGGPNDDQIQPVTPKDQRAIEADFRSRLDFQTKTADLDGYVCYAGALNSLVIRSNGTINKCTVALNSDSNAIGQLNPDGSLSIKQEKLRPWIDALLSGDPDVMGCPLHHVLDATSRSHFAAA